jgi:hypothetical protein
MGPRLLATSHGRRLGESHGRIAPEDFTASVLLGETEARHMGLRRDADRIGVGRARRDCVLS